MTKRFIIRNIKAREFIKIRRNVFFSTLAVMYPQKRRKLYCRKGKNWPRKVNMFEAFPGVQIFIRKLTLKKYNCKSPMEWNWLHRKIVSNHISLKPKSFNSLNGDIQNTKWKLWSLRMYLLRNLI